MLDFWRRATLPLGNQGLDTGHADDLAAIGREPDSAVLVRLGGNP